MGHNRGHDCTGCGPDDPRHRPRAGARARGGRCATTSWSQVLQTDDDRLPDLLALAHEVRMKYNGPDVEVEGIVSLKTGGCPEDCHFC